MINEFLAIGVIPKGNRTEQKVVCPNCIKIGKTNIKDTCLSINILDGLYNCHKCGWSGRVGKTEFKKEVMQEPYKIPQRPNITNLSDTAVNWFLGRSITQEVLIANKIAMTKDGNGIVFPYFRDGQLINYKTRLLAEKKFYQAKDAEPIMFNLDRIVGQKEIIVCEGEIDALSWEVAGHTNHTSVNQGAPNENDNNVDKKLECITNCYDVFESAEIIYLAVDNDNNGQRLQNELIRRFGAEKCKLVNFKDCKDANEYLTKYGTFELNILLKDAKDVKIEGIFTLQDNFDSMMFGFENGQQRGQTTYIDAVDNAWKWRKTEVNVWSGYQNEGKSLFLNQLSVLKAFMDGDKFAVFSPENMPMDDFYNDLIEMYIGQSTDPYYKDNQMTKADYLEGMSFIDKHFFTVYPDFDFTLDTILNKVKYLVRKQGIDHLIIDPYNTIEHLMKPNEREDLYISRFMATLKRFAIEQNISIHLVAHQITQRPNKDDGGRLPKPLLNNIKGGGTFADKADNVLFVWRPNRLIDFRDNEVVFGSQKIKKQKLVARPCDVDGITFEFKENRYYFNGICGLKLIDRKRNAKPIEIETAPFPMIALEDVKTVFDNDLPFGSDDNTDVPF
jgi:twinkle protein